MPEFYDGQQDYIPKLNEMAAGVSIVRNRYYGALPAAPTTRPDGTPMQPGDRYFDTAMLAERTFNGAIWYTPNIDSAALAAANGSAGVGFKQAGPDAVVRPAEDKLRDIVEAFDYMLPHEIADVKSGASTVDVTAKIQAAINATDGFVYISGVPKLTAALNITDKTTLKGAGKFTTTLNQTNLSAKILNFTGIRGGFSDMALDYAGTPTPGATAVYSSSAGLVANNFHINKCHIGIEVTSGPSQFFSQFNIDNYVSVGIYGHAANDCFFDHFILNAGNATNGALGGIRLVDFVEAFIFSDGDILNGVFPITTAASVYGMGSRPAYCNFINIFFDSAAQPASLDRIVESDFIGCWVSGGRSGAGNPGCELNTTDSIRFTNTRFFNCGSHGCVVQPAAVRTAYIGCSFESNSVTAGPGIAHGLLIATNASDFVVQGCKAHNGLLTGRQGYGIFLGGGTSDRYSIIGNMLAGNATGALAGKGSGLDITVTGNPGYKTDGYGKASVTLAAGLASIPHGLAVTPTYATAQAMTNYLSEVRIVSLDATNINIQMSDRDSGGIASGSYFILWAAKV